MAKMTYSEQLRHPNWQRRRLEILSRANFKCESCEATDKTLHVHHKRYRKGALAWEYSDTELLALCEDCHAAETLLRQQLDDAIACMSIGEIERLVGFAEGCVLIERLFDSDEPFEWQARSFEHAAGFLAEVLASLPSMLVYDVLRTQPLTSADIRELHIDAREILTLWWEATATSKAAALTQALIDQAEEPQK